mmetsp:Transcript_25607/g.51281  ORF Transcript_25607/g.51281 Transcript_25607/m.51281 type:complete len:228 (-) Transcript_25607:337-1020(-)
MNPITLGRVSSRSSTEAQHKRSPPAHYPTPCFLEISSSKAHIPATHVASKPNVRCHRPAACIAIPSAVAIAAVVVVAVVEGVRDHHPAEEPCAGAESACGAGTHAAAAAGLTVVAGVAALRGVAAGVAVRGRHARLDRLHLDARAPDRLLPLSAVDDAAGDDADDEEQRDHETCDLVVVPPDVPLPDLGALSEERRTLELAPADHGRTAEEVAASLAAEVVLNDNAI